MAEESKTNKYKNWEILNLNWSTRAKEINKKWSIFNRFKSNTAEKSATIIKPNDK